MVDKVPDQDNFGTIKRTLMGKVGLGPVPVIKIISSKSDELYLGHVFDGRNLDFENTQKTLEHFYYFWPGKIILETKTFKRNLPFIYKYDGAHHASYRKREGVP